ncbi:hypothetical protein ACIB24_09455 [Spongisporangium articulatum]|uniref:Tetratricopeptide repeat-containing protein n=1 Tax=Spongisporangium articulatum TaxID=3362603 RepID=A0ABW8AMV3_9ACTN
MTALERLRKRLFPQAPQVNEPGGPADRAEEETLRARLAEDPNEVASFNRLAQIVASRAAEGHEGGDLQTEADDAVWALAEEIAQSSRAWYPLIELARLSIDDDRDVALRRLSTAAERDASGVALAQGLAMLRDAGHAVDALNLGVGHWRPREHVVDAGRQLVQAAVEAGRTGEARRHLDALTEHPDQETVAAMREELEARIALADEAVQAGQPAHFSPNTGVIDVSTTSRLRQLLRRGSEASE